MNLKNGLKLYVVGEQSGNPGDWPTMCCRAYVIAHSIEEAAQLACMGSAPVSEIATDEPQVLFVEEDNGTN